MGSCTENDNEGIDSKSFVQRKAIQNFVNLVKFNINVPVFIRRK